MSQVMSPAQTGPDLPGAIMTAEIQEQPTALERLLVEGLANIQAVAAVVAHAHPKFILLAARGTSDHAALYAKYLVETRLRTPGGLVSPSTFTVYDTAPDLRDVLWVCVSQSGRSPDLVEATSRARHAGAFTLAVTNDADSPLNQIADLGIDVLAGPERAVAATKSYTNELLALYLLVDALTGGDASQTRRLPELAQQVVDRAEANAFVPKYRFVERLIVTGRGYSYPTAREGALKLMETSRLSAHAFSSADLMHGPLALVDARVPVIAVVPYGVAGSAMEPALDRLRGTGAEIMVVGDSSRAPLGSDSIWLPDDLSDALAPIIQVIPLQQLACGVAVSVGLDPDAPRGLAKVTHTR